MKDKTMERQEPTADEAGDISGNAAPEGAANMQEEISKEIKGVQQKSGGHEPAASTLNPKAAEFVPCPFIYSLYSLWEHGITYDNALAVGLVIAPVTTTNGEN